MSGKERAKFKEVEPYILFHVGSLKRKTSCKVAWGDSMIFKEEIKYKKVPAEASKIYFEVMGINVKTEM
jgi:hypothetical protein